MKNKYMRHAHLSERKFKFILTLFSEDLSATKTAAIGHINRNAANELFGRFRARISELLKLEPLQDCCFAQIDESFFGPRRIRGKRGRGAGGKIIVFGIWDPSGHVHCEVVPNCRKATLFPIILRYVRNNATIHSDGLYVYKNLSKLGYKHSRIRHDKDKFCRIQDGQNIHVNDIESFWSWAKERLIKFHGLRKPDFEKHLTETVFRFNHRHKGIYKLLLDNFREMPI